MIRVESLIAVGFFLGAPLWIGAVLAVQRYLRWRDGRILNTRVADNLNQVETDRLLDELSSRDDLTHANKKGS